MPTQSPVDPVRSHRRLSDASHLNWLLLVPVVVCLAVPFYNRTDPSLFGIPFFYWFQLVTIPIGVTCTLIVFLAHRKDREA